MSSLLVDNVTRVPTKVETNFFRLWVEFLRPYHDLTERESEIFAILLKCRHQLSKEIHNQELLDQVLFSDENKKVLYKELNITSANFYMIMTRLKKKKLIINGRLNKKFIPVLKEGAKEFKMLVLFDFTND